MPVEAEFKVSIYGPNEGARSIQLARWCVPLRETALGGIGRTAVAGTIAGIYW